jgi:hypothetical protein
MRNNLTILTANRHLQKPLPSPIGPVQAPVCLGFGKLLTVASGTGAATQWNWEYALPDNAGGWVQGAASPMGPCTLAPGVSGSAGSYGTMYRIVNGGTTGGLAILFGGLSSSGTTGTTSISTTSILAASGSVLVYDGHFTEGLDYFHPTLYGTFSGDFPGYTCGGFTNGAVIRLTAGGTLTVDANTATAPIYTLAELGIQYGSLTLAAPICAFDSRNNGSSVIAWRMEGEIHITDTTNGQASASLVLECGKTSDRAYALFVYQVGNYDFNIAPGTWPISQFNAVGDNSTAFSPVTDVGPLDSPIKIIGVSRSSYQNGTFYLKYITVEISNPLMPP